MHKIPEILRTRKARDAGLVMAILMLAAVSFGLGRLSVPAPSGAVAVYELTAPDTSALVTQAVPSTPGSTDLDAVPTGEYVASKSGSAYHLPWCSGATRIKEENKVWFASKAEAEAAGYRPAANCKGL